MIFRYVDIVRIVQRCKIDLCVVNKVILMQGYKMLKFLLKCESLIIINGAFGHNWYGYLFVLTNDFPLRRWRWN